MSDLQLHLEACIANTLLCGEATASRRIVVGLSGGLDSTVLLHLLHNFVKGRSNLSLVALHVNHGLQAQAEQWEQLCVQKGESYGVTTYAMRANVGRNTGEGLEQAARHARYQAFAEFLQEGDLLCLAHHQDDQAETVLYRLLRGSGPLGLAAMRSTKPFAGVQIARPLLSCSRKALEEYAQLHQLTWVDDPSNLDISFDRNYLRREIMPRLKSRWPAVNETFSRAAELNQETVLLLEELAVLDLAIVACEDGQRLCLQQLNQLSPPRINNVLRFWLLQNGRPLPSRANLLRIREELIGAQAAGLAVVDWPGAEVRAFEGQLYCMPNLVPAPKKGTEMIWKGVPLDQQFDLGAEAGALRMTAAQGQGIKSQLFQQAHKQGRLIIKWREGGERCQPEGRTHSQKLKKLLQEYHVPPWLRGRLPLVYIGEQLAAAPGLWVCKGFAANPDEKGCVLDWLYPSQ
jgi:tRNA(Ile)-lysidine synthase